MSKVLILSKTKMQEDRVCVGGVDLDNRCSVRLLDCNGHHETIDECPYDLLSVWDIEYTRIHRRPAPHLEDVKVTRRHNTKKTVSPIELLKLANYNIRIYNHTSLQETFTGKLLSTEGGSFYVNEEYGVPNFSTCFWICDKTLWKSKYSKPEKIKFSYKDENENWFQITYVGIEEAPNRIPKGSLVRLSLAHWWCPEGSNTEKRCYLQLSGFYDIDKPKDIECLSSTVVASSSQEESYALYTKGMSIAEISNQRGLSQSTICNHLTEYIRLGKIDIHRLVSKETIRQVKDFYERNPQETRLKPCYEHLNGAISYEEIRLIYAHMRKK